MKLEIEISEDDIRSAIEARLKGQITALMRVKS